MLVVCLTLLFLLRIDTIRLMLFLFRLDTIQLCCADILVIARCDEDVTIGQNWPGAPFEGDERGHIFSKHQIIKNLESRTKIKIATLFSRMAS